MVPNVPNVPLCWEGALIPAKVVPLGLPGWLLDGSDKEASLRVANGKDTCHKHKRSSKAALQASGLLPMHVFQGKIK